MNDHNADRLIRVVMDLTKSLDRHTKAIEAAHAMRAVVLAQHDKLTSTEAIRAVRSRQRIRSWLD